jgi:translocation and assembly module TamB
MGRRTRHILRMIVLAVGVVALALLFLSTPPAARWIAAAVLRTVDLGGARLTADSIDGRIFSQLTLFEARLIAADGATMVAVDTLHARYRLWPLLRREVRLDTLVATNASVAMRQDAAGAWDLLSIVPRDTAESRWHVSIGAVALRDIRAEIRSFAEGRDSTYRVLALGARARDVTFGSSVAFAIDTLHATLVFPDTTHRVSLHTRASLYDRRFDLGGLTLTSPASRVEGSGTVWLGEGDDRPGDAAFSLRAQPLAFDDIRLLAPWLAPGDTARIDLDVRHDAGAFRADLHLALPDSGSIQASAFTRPYDGEGLVYRLTAHLRGVDPGRLAGPTYRGAIDAAVQVDLEGTRRDSLRGEVRLDIERMRIGAIALDSSSVAAVVAGGEAELALQLVSGESRVDGRGWIRPFDDRPAYRLEATFAAVDLARFGTPAGWRSDLNFALVAEGQGIGRRDAAATARLAFAPSTVNASRPGTGEVLLALAGGRLDFSTALQAGEARIGGRGALELMRPYRVRVEEGIFEGVDVAALLGDTTRNEVRGRFALEASGTSVDDLALDGRLTVMDSYYGTVHCREAMLDASVASGEGRFALDGRCGGGTIRLAGRGRPFDAEPTGVLDEGRLEAIDLATWLGRPSVRTHLNASLQADGQGGSAPRARARLVLDPSRVNSQPIDAGLMDIDLAPDSIQIGLAIEIPDGGARLRALLVDRENEWTYRLEDGALEGVDLGAWLGNASWSTDLHGRFQANGVGFDPTTASLDARGVLRESQVNGLPLPEASLDWTMRAGSADGAVRVWFGEGDAEARVRLRDLGVRPAFTLDGGMRDFDVSAFFGLDTLASRVNGAVRLEGIGRDLSDLQLAGLVLLQPGSFAGFEVRSGFGQFRVEEGTLDVDSLVLATNAFVVEGRGGVHLDRRAARPDTELSVEARLGDSSPLRRYLAVDRLGVRRGEVSARLSSRPDDYLLETRFALEGLVYGSSRMAEVQARWTAALSPEAKLTNSDLFGHVEVVSVPGLLIERIDFEGVFDLDRLPFIVDARIEGDRRARVAGTLYTTPEQRRVDLEDIQLTIDRDRWTLDGPASISLGSAFRVRRFLLESGDQQIAVDGLVDLQGEQNLGVSIDALRIDAFAGWLGWEGLGGRLTGNLDLRGPAAAPRIVSNANISLASREEAVGDLAVIALYDSLRLDIDLFMQHREGSTLLVDGYVPARLALVADSASAMGVRSSMAEGTVALNARADSFALGWLMPFLDRTLVDRLDGTLTSRLRVEGTAAAPVLQGEGRFRVSALHAPFLGVGYTDVGIDFTARDNVFYIDDARARTGDGRVDAAGVLALSSLTAGTFDIDIAARQFLAVDSKEYRALGSGNLHLGGTLANPALEGDITLRSADLFLDAWAEEEDASVPFSTEDLLMLERTFGVRVTEKDTSAFDLYEAMSIDLDVRMDRDTWLRSRLNPEMNIQFTGRLDVTKASFTEEVVFGSIEVVPERSYIKEFGKRFALQKGTLSFNGPATSPVMDVEARYEVPNPRSQENAVIITLDAEGQPDALELTLSAEPTLELTDIISYIATGRPASESLLLGGSSNSAFASAGRGFAVSQGVGLLTGAIEDLVNKSGLELDVIQIEAGEDGKGATVTAGKYVTPRVYTSVSQPIGSADSGGGRQEIGTVVTLELQLVNALLLRLLGGESTLQVTLLVEHAY